MTYNYYGIKENGLKTFQYPVKISTIYLNVLFYCMVTKKKRDKKSKKKYEE